MAKRNIGVIAPGTPVKVSRHGNSAVSATVVSTQIGHGPSVRYEVAFWNLDDRKTMWVEPFELSVADLKAKPAKIGFVTEVADG